MWIVNYKRLVNFIFSVVFIGLWFNGLNAQNCNNIGFDNGTFDGWEAEIGVAATDGSIESLEKVDPSTRPERFKLIKNQELDQTVEAVCSNLSIITKNVESIYSVRLGNSNSGAQVDVLTRSLVVDNESALLIYRFAVVFEDPEHQPVEQPQFKFTVTDTDGNELPCGVIEYTASASLPGFETCNSSIVARDWSAAAVDLSPYVGQEIVLRFESRDCSLSGHFGYSYLDVECAPLSFIPFDYCEGDPFPQQVEISAPKGFSAYLWDDGTTKDSKLVVNAQPNDVHTVSMSSDNGCTVTLANVLVPNDKRPDLLELDTSFCENRVAEIEIRGENIFAVLSADKQDTFYQDIIPFNYTDEESILFYALGPGRCFLDSVLVNIEPIFNPEYTLQDTVIGCINTFVDISLDADKASYSVFWDNSSFGYTTRYFIQDSIATYSVRVNSNNICNVDIVQDFVALAVIPGKIDIEVGRPDSCSPLNTFLVDNTTKIVLSSFSVNGEEYLIDRNDSNAVFFALTKPGKYSIDYLGTTSEGCTVDTLWVDSLQVYPNTPVHLQAKRAVMGDTLDTWRVVNLNARTNALLNDWSVEESPNFYSDRDDELFVELDNRDRYIKRVDLLRINEFGCTDSGFVTINGFNKSVYNPTAFSPNGDGDNDTYKPLCHNCIEEDSYYTVYNRWGEAIFTSDFTRAWNGVTVDGKVADKGQYNVKLRVRYINIFAEDIMAPLVILR